MSWPLIALIMVVAALTARSSDSVDLKSLCVLDEAQACWIDKEAGEQRTPQPGDYVLSPEDMNRILEKLKAVR